MMIANVMSAGPLTRGTVRGLSDADTYVFDLVAPPCHTCQGLRVVNRVISRYPDTAGYLAGTPSGSVSHSCPDCFGVAKRWEYQGKVTGDVFIPAGVQGYEHIPQEFYAALDQSFVTNSPVEFRDPFLDDLAVQGA